MGRSGRVYRRGMLAGRIEELPDAGYRFTYDTGYLASAEPKPVSLTLPLQVEPIVSPTLFPFFYGLLAEGNLKAMQCQKLKLDKNDHFGRLLKTAGSDTIGDVTVVEETESS